MKKLLWIAIPALLFAAQPAQAQVLTTHTMPPVKMDGGVTLKFNLFAGGGRTQLGPWYQYWPYEAHFNMAPPLGQATPGPMFMTLAPGMMGHQQQPWTPPMPQGQAQPWQPPTPTPVPPMTQAQRSGYQQVGYYYYSQAPSYRYGR